MFAHSLNDFKHRYHSKIDSQTSPSSLFKIKKNWVLVCYSWDNHIGAWDWHDQIEPLRGGVLQVTWPLRLSTHGLFSHHDPVLKHYKSPLTANRRLHWGEGLTRLLRYSQCILKPQKTERIYIYIYIYRERERERERGKALRMNWALGCR